jgi:hypothetical protein
MVTIAGAAYMQGGRVWHGFLNQKMLVKKAVAGPLL